MKWLDRHTVRAPHIALCMSERDFQQAARHCKLKDAGSWMEEGRHKAVVHTWENGGQLTCIVCLHPDAANADPIDVACTLVHESVHIFQRLCDSIGEHQPSAEFEAYSIERISESLMREFVRQTQGKS
jgi:hypothetical protein